MALRLFLETLMTANEIAPSCVSIVADNAQAERSPKLCKSKRTAIDSSVQKGKIRWSATTALVPSRTGRLEKALSDSVLSRPKRVTSPGRETRSNAFWDDSSRFMEQPLSKETCSSSQICRTSRAQTPSLHTGAESSTTRKSLSSISEACNTRALVSSSSPEKTPTMQRAKSLDSNKLYNRIDLHISQSTTKKDFQRAEIMPLNAAESSIKTDSLLQALGMMAPSASPKNSKLIGHVVKPGAHQEQQATVLLACGL
jgi:hypothetical protein